MHAIIDLTSTISLRFSIFEIDLYTIYYCTCLVIFIRAHYTNTLLLERRKKAVVSGKAIKNGFWRFSRFSMHTPGL